MDDITKRTYTFDVPDDIDIISGGTVPTITLEMLDEVVQRAKAAGLKPLRIDSLTREEAEAFAYAGAAVAKWAERHGLNEVAEAADEGR